jgi:hypothetical protein
MYTSILLAALTGVAPTAEAGKAPKWSLDYTAACKQAAQEKKPLVVILAPGEGAYQKLGRDGGLGAEAEGQLAEKYVCVHIDTNSARGKELAKAFAIPEGLGIVISDRTGEKQAFRHEGDLARADLVRYLQRYGDPNYVFVETESNPGHAPYGAPVSYAGGYCSTCGGGCGVVTCGGGGCGGGCGVATCGGGGCGGGRGCGNRGHGGRGHSVASCGGGCGGGRGCRR